jgi:cellulose biosynthesis protein BcsQ
MAVAVSLINMKGGVGKTTLAAQLAHAAARKGLRTLAVDLDPQANLSQALLSREKYFKYLQDKKPTIVQIFEQYFPPTDDSASPRPLEINEVILKKAAFQSKIDLIVSRLELSHTLKNPHSKERRLAKALAQVADDYDLILIDCAPTESILTEAAYHASGYVLVPVKPEFLATIGLPLLARSIQEFKYTTATTNSIYAVSYSTIHRRTPWAQRENDQLGKCRAKPRKTAGLSSKPKSAIQPLMPKPQEKAGQSVQQVMFVGQYHKSLPDSSMSSSLQSD